MNPPVRISAASASFLSPAGSEAVFAFTQPET
jgi:hypothetical protein